MMKITHKNLIKAGYLYNGFGNYCPPYPADGSTYRIELKATHFKGNKPVEGTEKWRAFLPYDILPTIRRFETMEELNLFHCGMTFKSENSVPVKP